LRAEVKPGEKGECLTAELRGKERSKGEGFTQVGHQAAKKDIVYTSAGCRVGWPTPQQGKATVVG